MGNTFRSPVAREAPRRTYRCERVVLRRVPSGSVLARHDFYNPWSLHRLAWLQLAAKDEPAFQATCKRLRNLSDHANDIRLSAWLSSVMPPCSPLASAAALFAAEPLVQKHETNWADWIVYTACMRQESGIGPDALLVLARKNVDRDRQSWIYRQSLGFALFRAGKTPDAFKELQEAIKLHDMDHKKHPEGTLWMRLVLALSYQQFINTEEANEWCNKAALWIAHSACRHEESGIGPDAARCPGRAGTSTAIGSPGFIGNR